MSVLKKSNCVCICWGMIKTFISQLSPYQSVGSVSPERYHINALRDKKLGLPCVIGCVLNCVFHSRLQTGTAIKRRYRLDIWFIACVLALYSVYQRFKQPGRLFMSSGVCCVCVSFKDTLHILIQMLGNTGRCIQHADIFFLSCWDHTRSISGPRRVFIVASATLDLVCSLWAKNREYFTI